MSVQTEITKLTKEYQKAVSQMEKANRYGMAGQAAAYQYQAKLLDARIAELKASK